MYQTNLTSKKRTIYIYVRTKKIEIMKLNNTVEHARKKPKK